MLFTVSAAQEGFFFVFFSLALWDTLHFALSPSTKLFLVRFYALGLHERFGTKSDRKSSKLRCSYGVSVKNYAIVIGLV